MPEDRRLVPGLSVEENVLLPAWSVGMPDAAERLAEIYRAIPEVSEFRARKALQLSGGQQKLVALARAMMAGRDSCSSTSPSRAWHRCSPGGSPR